MKLKADTVQGVVFTNPRATQIDAMALWAQLFPGDTPDGFQRNVNAPNLLSTASGERNGYNLTVNSQVGRVDLVIGPSVSTLGIVSPSEPPRIDDIEGATIHLTDLQKRIADLCTAIRLSVVLDTGVTVARGEEANAVQELLEGVAIPSGAVNVNFQFNVPVMSESVSGLPINRHCLFNSGEVGFFQAAPTPVGIPQRVNTTPFVGIKADVNTHPRNSIPPGSYAAVIDELAAHAVKVVRNGMKSF